MREENNSIISFLELPDYLTLLGAVFGIVAMLCSVNQRFVVAAVFLILSVLCDFYDGKIARLINRKNKVFGEMLDSAVDTVSFVAAPLMFGYSLGLTSPLAVGVLLIFAIAAFLRLARFSCVKTTDKGFFLGMPVTYNNLIFPIVYLVMHVLHIDTAIQPTFLLLYILATALMGSTIRWIKF